MQLKSEVLERLLLSKAFLDRIRFQPVAVHDRHTLASNIVTAHDSAELAIASICDQLNCLPQKGTSYLMNYLDSLKTSQHPGTDVPARGYFRDLNDVRNLVKHHGLFPDGRQWARVGETVFQHISKWVWDYLQESFADLDESVLLLGAGAKSLYDRANESFNAGEYKRAPEQLALALSVVFRKNAALRGLEVGVAKSEDAIRLAGFGVHGNDFLALQEFLPQIGLQNDKTTYPRWRQSMFGHAGNWTEQAVAFCLRTFVDVTVKIQGAEWIPGALQRKVVYEQQVEAIADKVEIWRYEPKKTTQTTNQLLPLLLLTQPHEVERVVVKVLSRGERLRALVMLASEETLPLQLSLGGPKKSTEIADIFFAGANGFYGQIKLADVKVTCVPKEADFIKQYFPDLPEFEWDPE